MADGGWRIRAAPPARNRWRWCFFVVLSCVGLIRTQYGGSAAGSANRGTVPPSAYGAGLVSMPSPVDNTNNLVMTGNVSGGKSFRGNVPYGSTTSFGAPLGSTSLDPFLRYSSIPEGLGNGPSDYSPFYSPTGTVPKMPPGASGVFAPGSPRVVAGKMLSPPEQPAEVISLPQTPPPQVPPGRTETSVQAWQGLRPVPLTATPDEMRQILAGASHNPPAGDRPSTPNMQPLSAEEYRRQVDQLQRDFERVKTSASEFEQNLRADRQSYAAALGQTPAQTTPPFATGEALRRIVLPQSQLQTQLQYPIVDPVPGQSLSLGNDGISQSQGQLTLQVPGSAALDGGAPRAPGSALGYLEADPPGQAASLPELALVSPQGSLTGARGGAAAEPRVPLYVPPAAP
ncbi:MAG: hypothetical protein M1376_12365, partial [Planctomycetes bacterium]|nr:hypothetical protein [Planctomycetota bacterium]